jgi:hypothetical protein
MLGFVSRPAGHHEPTGCGAPIIGPHMNFHCAAECHQPDRDAIDRRILHPATQNLRQCRSIGAAEPRGSKQAETQMHGDDADKTAVPRSPSG